LQNCEVNESVPETEALIQGLLCSCKKLIALPSHPIGIFITKLMRASIHFHNPIIFNDDPRESRGVMSRLIYVKRFKKKKKQLKHMKRNPLPKRGEEEQGK
jgi:hypothetical protein